MRSQHQLCMDRAWCFTMTLSRVSLRRCSWLWGLVWATYCSYLNASCWLSICVRWCRPQGAFNHSSELFGRAAQQSHTVLYSAQVAQVISPSHCSVSIPQSFGRGCEQSGPVCLCSLVSHRAAKRYCDTFHSDTKNKAPWPQSASCEVKRQFST